MAASNAIQNPLLDEVSLRGAKAVLVNVTGGLDMTLLEVDEAANAISEQVDPEGNIIFGAAFDPTLQGKIRVSVVATGMDGASMSVIEPRQSRNVPPPPAIRIPEAMPEAAPAVAPVPAPASFAPASAPAVEPASFAAAPVAPAPVASAPAEPALFGDSDPVGGGFLAAEQGDLLSVEPAAAPVPAPVEAAPVLRAPEPVIKKIVDPEVATEDDLENLFPTSVSQAQPAPRPTGFRLWGQKRPARFDPPPAAASPRAGGALPAEAPGEATAPEGENLDIPAFLRRLAN